MALDTSTRFASVALFDGVHVLSETTWLAGREHSTRLLAEIENALARAGCEVHAITGVVVARGPGSFTGVRVALSVAKGLAGGLGVPVWGVSSLEVLALTAHPSAMPVRVVIEAGRGRYATALYVHGHETTAPKLVTLPQLMESLSEGTVVIGEIAEEDRTSLAEDSRVRLAPLAASVRRGGYLAELGWRMAQRGDAGDARSLDAIYIT